MKMLRVSILFICVFAGGCARSVGPVELEPYESLFQILADFSLHRSDDLYRLGYPRDITGINLFRAVLKRLENYETLNPGQYSDIVAVSKGQLQERLGNYEAAALEYSNLGSNPSEEMRGVAQQNLARVNALSAAARRPMDSSNLARYLAELEIKREDLRGLAGQFAGTPYEYLALIESEQADVERAILLFNSRYLLPDGLSRALREGQALIQRHEQSNRVLQHRLMLGDFYATAARDYAAVNPPERSSFHAEEFESLIAGAREQYFYVSRQDGAPEKLEARGHLQALEAFNRKVNDLGSSGGI